MRGKIAGIIGLLLVAVSLVPVSYLFKSTTGQRFQANITDALSGEGPNNLFKRAIDQHDFVFPTDYGPHPDFQTEWWYYTGNLKTSAEEHFGYQLTIFRRALSGKAQVEKGSSRWRTRQIYFAHFAISDIENQQFYSFEKFSRGALGLAGAESSPFRVWLENWQMTSDGDTVILQAQDGEVSLNLNLVSTKPIVLQGEQGLSQKGRGLGNASYYYSQPRINSSGTISIAGNRYEVEGVSWLDREWSTSVLERGATGWDWFALQLEDQTELMVFQIRTQNGSISPFSAGVFIAADSTTKKLRKSDFKIHNTSFWRSPQTDIIYPSGWDITIPSLDLSLSVTPMLPSQEHRHSFRYWEGAVKVSSQHTNGFGYVELTGY